MEKLFLPDIKFDALLKNPLESTETGDPLTCNELTPFESATTPDIFTVLLLELTVALSDNIDKFICGFAVSSTIMSDAVVIAYSVEYPVQ